MGFRIGSSSWKKPTNIVIEISLMMPTSNIHLVYLLVGGTLPGTVQFLLPTFHLCLLVLFHFSILHLITQGPYLSPLPLQLYTLLLTPVLLSQYFLDLLDLGLMSFHAAIQHIQCCHSIWVVIPLTTPFFIAFRWVIETNTISFAVLGARSNFLGFVVELAEGNGFGIMGSMDGG